MTFDIAKAMIDKLLNDELIIHESIILEFIGGEPLLEIDLIDQICDYFKIESYKKHKKWWWNYRISIGSNGILYMNEKVQQFFAKNTGKVSFGISIDGNKIKHDMHRVFPDGSGSFNLINHIIPDYIKRFRPATKATFSSADLIYLKDSMIWLMENGITDIAANVVYEDVWRENDDLVFENQLKELADYILEHDLYNDVYCSFFNDQIGYYLDKEDLNKPTCGTGKMISISGNGNLYPCLRYKDYSLNNTPEWLLGNVLDKFDKNKLRPFVLSSKKMQLPKKCLDCPVAFGCDYCQGFSYDDSDTNTNFSRSTYNCKMHKARVRANDYYFNHLFYKKGIEKDELDKDRNRLFVLLSNDSLSFCPVSHRSVNREFSMNEEILDNTLLFGKSTFSEIWLVHSQNQFDFEWKEKYEDYKITHLIPLQFLEQSKDLKRVIYVIDQENLDFLNTIDGTLKNCIFNIELGNIKDLANNLEKILMKFNRVNVNIILENEFDDFIKLYEQQLIMISDYLIENSLLRKKEINVLTDELYLKNRVSSCLAGDKYVTVAPNGKLYNCPFDYYDGSINSEGDIYSGRKDREENKLYRQEYQILCQGCTYKHCQNCKKLNKVLTNEVNIPSDFICKKTALESHVTQYLKSKSEKLYKEYSIFIFEDPIQRFVKEEKRFIEY